MKTANSFISYIIVSLTTDLPSQKSSRRNPFVEVVNVLDGDVVESELKIQSHYYVHFHTNAPGERYEPSYFPTHLWVKEHHYCSSTRMNLALNNP